MIGLTEDNAPRIHEGPVNLHVRECTEQLSKLIAVVAEVEDRLSIVRCPRRPDDPHTNASQETIQEASPLATALSANVRTVKETQHRLRRLLEDLEL